MVYGVIIHKLPVAIILATFFLESGISKKITFTFMILFALMTPIGSLLSEYLSVIKEYEHQILGLVVGIFLHIATIILFESSEGHKFNLKKLITISIGFATAYFI